MILFVFTKVEEFIYDKNFIYKKPLFKRARVYNLDTKEDVFYVRRKRASINVEYLQDIGEPVFEALSHWAVSKKVMGISFNRELYRDPIDVVVYGVTLLVLL